LKGADYQVPSGGLVWPYAPPGSGSAGCEGSDDVGSVPIEVCCARASSAAAKAPGNVSPRLAARRRIPLAAFGLKKYFDRCGPVSKTSGNEDTRASLGNSEVLSVQHSPRHAIPEFIQVADDGEEVEAVVDGE
jgi:hypothetical protein